MRLVSAEEMRRLDRLTIERYGTPGHVLMERAGTGAARVLLDLFPHMRRKGRRAVICCGKGNNGGDGLVVARDLRRRGVACDVVLLGARTDLAGDAARQLRAYERGRGRIHELSRGGSLNALAARLAKAEVVVDAIFGTGLNSEVVGWHAEIIELINASGVPVFALDMPSGLNADTGMPLGAAIQAEATATFGFAKIGQVLFPGAEHVGRLAVVDIGLAPEAVAEVPASTELLEARSMAALVPVRRPDAHKGDNGHVLVIAGSFGKTGAAQLVSRAAARAGAGLVTLVGPRSLYPIYAAGVLEAMTDALPDRDGRMLFDEPYLKALVAGKTAVVIGPGIGTHGDASRIVSWLLEHAGIPVVLDADALTCLAVDASILEHAAAPVVLTPHPGEMSRLLGIETAVLQADRVGMARAYAVRHRCTLVLKGARTVIAGSGAAAGAEGAPVWINPTGNPGMASGGMGDALSGILGGFLAQRMRPTEAACLAVYLHGVVADGVAQATGEIGLLASDVIAHVPAGLSALWKCLDA